MVTEVYAQENLSQEIFIRRFVNTDKNNLVWHRDKNDRVMTVLECGDWYFQFDNNQPIKLSKGDTIQIQKMIYHRLIKESGDLIIKIVESK